MAWVRGNREKPSFSHDLLFSFLHLKVIFYSHPKLSHTPQKGNNFHAAYIVEKISYSQVNFKASVFFVLYLALINRAGGLYGRTLTEVVSTDRTQ